jgi:hypothetical protein
MLKEKWGFEYCIHVVSGSFSCVLQTTQNVGTQAWRSLVPSSLFTPLPELTDDYWAPDCPPKRWLWMRLRASHDLTIRAASWPPSRSWLVKTIDVHTFILNIFIFYTLFYHHMYDFKYNFRIASVNINHTWYCTLTPLWHNSKVEL